MGLPVVSQIEDAFGDGVAIGKTLGVRTLLWTIEKWISIGLSQRA